MTIAFVFAALAAGTGALFVLRRRFVAVTVVGDSMMPTLHPGDRVLVRRVPLRRVRRGQLVVVRPQAGLPDPGDSPPAGSPDPGDSPPAGSPDPGDRPPWLVKRAVALPGDAVPAAVPGLDDGSGVVPAGLFVILGDNTGRSYDSRRAGYFRAESLLGVVVRTLH